MNVRFTRLARDHYLEVVRWYRERSDAGAGLFRIQVRAARDRLAEFPESAQEIDSGLRRARIIGTPYSLFYIIDRDEVVVLGILHGRQSPAEWRKLIT